MQAKSAWNSYNLLADSTKRIKTRSIGASNKMANRTFDSEARIDFSQQTSDNIWRQLSGVLTGDFASWIPDIDRVVNPSGHSVLLSNQKLHCMTRGGERLDAVLKMIENDRFALNVEFSDKLSRNYYIYVAKSDRGCKVSFKLFARGQDGWFSSIEDQEKKYFYSAVRAIKGQHSSGDVAASGFG